MLRDYFGLLRPGHILEFVGAAAGLYRKGPVAALGLALVPGGPWCLEDSVLEISSALFEVLAACVSELAGWPEAEVPSGLVERYRVSAVFGGATACGF